MKTILVPVDFSPGADAALDFAIITAKQQKASILLLHVYSISQLPHETTYEVLARESREKASLAMRQLRSLSMKIEYAGGIDYDIVLKEGEAVHTIVKVAEETQAGLIVMGTRAEQSVPDHVFGTTSTGVVELAPCPVIAVPPHYRLNPAFQKITYATDLLKTDVGAIRDVAELARPVNAVLSVLHVSAPGEKIVTDAGRLHKFIEEIGQQVNYPRLTLELLAGTDAVDELKSYIDDRKTDMLVLSTRHRSLLGRIFDRGVTKELVNYAAIPVMAFHHRKHAAIRIYTALI